MNTYVRLGLVAAAVLAVVIIGIGLFGRSTDDGPPVGTESSAPSVGAEASTPFTSPSARRKSIHSLGRGWLHPVTCEQQTAAVAAAFTPEQMALAWSCTEADPVQYNIVFYARQAEDGTRHLREYAERRDGLAWCLPRR